MAFKARLQFSGNEYDVLNADYSFTRDVDSKGRPSSSVYGGTINVEVESTEDTSIGGNQTVSASKGIATTEGSNYSLSAAGDISEDSDNRTEIASKDFNRQSETSNELASEMTIFSNKENMTLQSGKTIKINSVEKSKLF